MTGTSPRSLDYTRQAQLALRRFYGYSAFRPMQLEIILNALEGNDALVLMPTGGGKSICYQIPALLRDGVTLVISPLISLMADQVSALQANGIPAAAINSANAEDANRTIMENAALGQIKLLYLSPERMMADFDRISSLPVNMVAIDEAHCISQWGHDFRPVYTQLNAIRRQMPEIPVMALTATADRLTRTDIIKQLNLRDCREFISSFDRPNISIRVINGSTKASRIAFIERLVRKYPFDSGIVYCLSRKTCETMNAELQRRDIASTVYHAGLTPERRDTAQRRFINGEVQVVCATVALGMGIDKSNIRWVVHNNMPQSMESYYQEIGRAGRDGMPAEAIMFFNYGDLITLRSFVEESGLKAVNMEKLKRIQQFAEASVCRRRILLSYFNESVDHDCHNCDICLDPPTRIDGTEIVLKALSAALRTRERAGITMLADILIGSARTDIVSAGFHLIKTYGAGRDMPRNAWLHYITQMIQLGILEIAYDEGNHLKVTPLGRNILNSRHRVELTEFKRPAAGISKRKKATPAAPISPDENLLNDLKQLRRKIAKAEGVPPYIVFSDKSLADMAARRPVTREEFAETEGVGEKKTAKYWRAFTTEIKQHL